MISEQNAIMKSNGVQSKLQDKVFTEQRLPRFTDRITMSRASFLSIDKVLELNVAVVEY